MCKIELNMAPLEILLSDFNAKLESPNFDRMSEKSDKITVPLIIYDILTGRPFLP